MPRAKSKLQEIIDSGKCPGFRVSLTKPFVDRFTFEKPVVIHSERQFKDECKKRGFTAMHKSDLMAIARQS